MNEEPKGRRFQKTRTTPASKPLSFTQTAEDQAAKYRFILDPALGVDVLLRTERNSRAAVLRARKPRRRRHDLMILLERVYRALRRKGYEPTTAAVLKNLKKYDVEEIVYDTYSGKGPVPWTDWRSKEQETAVGTIRNQLTRIRRRAKR